jgi:hypothetical protein
MLIAFLGVICSSTLAQSEVSFNAAAEVFKLEAVKDKSWALFEVSPDGTIIDGPRRASGEPIDYSSIITTDALAELFEQSIMGCIEGVRYCVQVPFKLQSKRLTFSISSKSEKSELKKLLNQIFKETIGLAGFVATSEESDDVHSVQIFVGDISYLIKSAKEIDDSYGVEFFELFESSSKMSNLFDPCYLSTKYRVSNRTYVLIAENYFSVCLPRLLFETIGINETATYLPTVSSINSDYLVATLADLSFVEALYGGDFVFRRSSGQVAEYYRTTFNKSTKMREILIEEAQ